MVSSLSFGPKISLFTTNTIYLNMEIKTKAFERICATLQCSKWQTRGENWCYCTGLPTHPSNYNIRQEATAWESHVQQADMSVPDFTRLATLDQRPISSPGFFFHLQPKAKEESQEGWYKETHGWSLRTGKTNLILSHLLSVFQSQNRYSPFLTYFSRILYHELIHSVYKSLAFTTSFGKELHQSGTLQDEPSFIICFKLHF